MCVYTFALEPVCLSTPQKTNKQTNKRTPNQFQEEAGWLHTVAHRQGEGGDDVQLQIVGQPHFKGALMDDQTKKAQQLLYFLEGAKETKSVTVAFGVPPPLLH